LNKPKRRECDLPSTTKSPGDVNEDNVFAAESRLNQSACVMETVQTSAGDKKLDTIAIFKRRVCNARIILIHPWIFSKIAQLLFSKIGILCQAIFLDTLVTFFLVSFKQRLSGRHLFVTC
jgi:hypothetical protein